MPFADLIEAADLCSENGVFAVIIPFKDAFLALAKEHELYPIRLLE
jgi:hypothetical protein